MTITRRVSKNKRIFSGHWFSGNDRTVYKVSLRKTRRTELAKEKNLENLAVKRYGKK